MMYRRQCDRGGAGRFSVAIAPGLEVSGLGDDIVTAADRGLAMVQNLGESPAGAVPAVAGAARAAKVMRLGLRAATSGQLQSFLEGLGPKTRKSVVSFLGKVFR